MARLVLPSIKYQESFLAGLTKESQYLDWPKQTMLEDFAKFVRELRGRARGLFLPKGFVQDIFYWLVEEGRYIGTFVFHQRLVSSSRFSTAMAMGCAVHGERVPIR